MRECIVCILLCVVVNMLAAQESAVIADTLALKLSLYTREGDALEKINEYRGFIRVNNAGGISEEDMLACENILLIEECNFSPSDSDVKKSLYLSLRAQNDKCGVYMNDNKRNSVYFLTSFGDIKARLLAFLPSADMIRESMEAKRLYTEALRIDRRSAYALTSYALWQYFAPPISGGGYTAALGTFNKALKYSRTDGDTYFVYIYRSQLYLTMRRTNDSANDLEAAHRLISGEYFTALIREKNGNGKTIFD
jgi:tetratricopeptide (TPR) repeat protein